MTDKINKDKITHIVSAPGKVLLAGGYIVLDPNYTGLVFGLSARIHVVAQDVVSSSSSASSSEILVDSPQFDIDSWSYTYESIPENGGIKVTQVSSPTNKNHFVETTLNYVLSYITQHHPNVSIKPSRFSIVADNDYYSSTTPTTSSSSRFKPLGQTISKANKTGLGSSAALVTSLTGAILTHYLPSSLFSLSNPYSRLALHNLAQAVHCAAQGKIGSGFDVASAVYGSCIYRRFSPSILKAIPQPGTPGFAKAVEETIHGEWDHKTEKDKTAIPEGYAIRMVDVTGGTQTVSMVKSVNAWREANKEESDELFGELQGCVEGLAAALKEGEEGGIKKAMKPVREIMKKIGDLSGTPIEPESQTKMLDALEGVEGVVGSVVPGAGGYDAAAILVRDEQDKGTIKRVEKFLEGWSEKKGVKAKLLDVLGETEGVRVEDLKTFRW
ncbi:putative Phosphomevalonate kinase [Podospora fimiseda]|uniref:Phosphomevalonate kinase n=1 Tax=Podospora fimiseda TaxID=252190 RepID=A0AAN6YN05_9PEZI|nr:putative Phosphomevalonate kinase [Podospora fimiseda]